MIWSFKTGKIVADVKVISNFIKFARNANVPCGKILCSLLIFFLVSTLIMYSQIVLLKTAKTAKIFASLYHTKANSVLQSLLVLHP